MSKRKRDDDESASQLKIFVNQRILNESDPEKMHSVHSRTYKLLQDGARKQCNYEYGKNPEDTARISLPIRLNGQGDIFVLSGYEKKYHPPYEHHLFCKRCVKGARIIQNCSLCPSNLCEMCGISCNFCDALLCVQCFKVFERTKVLYKVETPCCDRCQLYNS